MKKVFGIINLVCILISILFVGVNFYSKIDSGKNVHKAVSTFLSDSENSILVSEISDCSYFVDMRLTNLTSEQKEYLYELSTVLDRLNQLTTSISPRLLLNDSKSSSAYKIINNLENLTNERTLFLEETEKFKIKITGNKCCLRWKNNGKHYQEKDKFAFRYFISCQSISQGSTGSACVRCIRKRNQRRDPPCAVRSLGCIRMS